MATPSPLLALHRDAGAVLLAYGAPSENADPAATSTPAIDIVATYGELELEYAAIRKHCGLLDLPNRGLLELRGPERVEFLNRMITQELRPAKRECPPFSVLRSFWLNRKGRIDADLRVIHLPDRTLLSVDALAAPHAARSLGAFIISEDCTLQDATRSTHCLALQGPTAPGVLHKIFTPDASCGAPPIDALADAHTSASVHPASVHSASIPPASAPRATMGSIAGVQVVIFREDSAGVPGYEVLMPAEHTLLVAQSLVQAGHDGAHSPRSHTSDARAFSLPILTPGPGTHAPKEQLRLTPVGWMAYNIARIEAGSPIFYIDFGPQNLPAETGILEQAVSFTKGCYLGQEVVARMHARKQVKQVLVSIAFESVAEHAAAGDRASTDGTSPYPTLPERGAAIAIQNPTDGSIENMGAITSSTLSPRRAMAPIALAQVRNACASPGTIVFARVPHEAHDPSREVLIKGVVQSALAPSTPVRSSAI
jgi:tRNA-modifying protein YgfZ